MKNIKLSEIFSEDKVETTFKLRELAVQKLMLPLRKKPLAKDKLIAVQMVFAENHSRAYAMYKLALSCIEKEKDPEVLISAVNLNEKTGIITMLAWYVKQGKYYSLAITEEMLNKKRNAKVLRQEQ
jgi:hypothetical protein